MTRRRFAVLVRYWYYRLLDLLDLPGNDGLTRRERAAYAEDFRRHYMRPLSDAEVEALDAWRKRKADS